MTEAAHVKHVEEQTEDKNGQKFQVHILPSHTHISALEIHLSSQMQNINVSELFA